MTSFSLFVFRRDIYIYDFCSLQTIYLRSFKKKQFQARLSRVYGGRCDRIFGQTLRTFQYVFFTFFFYHQCIVYLKRSFPSFAEPHGRKRLYH